MFNGIFITSACCHGLSLKTVKQSRTLTTNTNFMKKKFLLQPMVWSMILILLSCQKNEVRDNSNELLISKINSWLEKQKSEKQPNKASNIDLLKENIDFSALKFEGLNENEQFVVVPVKENYKIRKNIDKNTHATLLLVRDKTGNILRGNIVLYFPENNQQMNEIPHNTFYKMYAEKDLDCNGLFRFLSPTGTWMFQREYKNRKMSSFGFVKPDDTKAKTSTDCTLYFLNLYFWVDGVIVAQQTIYLGSICSSGGCDDGQNQSLCPDYGAGGGSGDGSNEPPEPCCISDPNVQFSSELSNTIRHDCGLEGIDPLTGNPTKPCIHEWTFHRWHFLWYNWDFTSFTNTNLEKEGGVWKFKTIAFQSVSRNGQLPPCASSECTINTANASISADGLTAKLILKYTIENRVACYQWWTPNNSIHTIKTDWSPPS